MHAALRDRGWIMKHMKINRLTRSHGQGRVSAAHGKQEDGCDDSDDHPLRTNDVRAWRSINDQRDVHRQIFEGGEMVEYAFMGEYPDAADNRWLREAFERDTGNLLLGIAPGRYQAMLPAFISGWDGNVLKARVAFGGTRAGCDGPAGERPRTAICVACRKAAASSGIVPRGGYHSLRWPCALSGLPDQRLLDAAHIISERTNG